MNENNKQITVEYLKEHGFESEYPDSALCRFEKHPNDRSYRIMVDRVYLPLSKELSWNVSCWSTDTTRNVINRRTSIMYTDSIDELEKVIKLANIEY